MGGCQSRRSIFRHGRGGRTKYLCAQFGGWGPGEKKCFGASPPRDSCVSIDATAATVLLRESSGRPDQSKATYVRSVRSFVLEIQIQPLLPVPPPLPHLSTPGLGGSIQIAERREDFFPPLSPSPLGGGGGACFFPPPMPRDKEKTLALELPFFSFLFISEPFFPDATWYRIGVHFPFLPVSFLPS